MIEWLEECDSTNTCLLERARLGVPSGSVLATRKQTGGRGRRGRSWVSAPGDSLTFSLLWRFTEGMPLAGLSLAVGVAVADVIGEGVQLKWPNDILQKGRKVGGILIELIGMAAVIGIGLNLRLPDALPEEVRASAGALGSDLSHEAWLAQLLPVLMDTLKKFERDGFSGLRERWFSLNAHADAWVRILSEGAPLLEGYCRGVDAEGALLLETTTGIQRVLSGDVSLRLV